VLLLCCQYGAAALLLQLHQCCCWHPEPKTRICILIYCCCGLVTDMLVPTGWNGLGCCTTAAAAWCMSNACYCSEPLLTTIQPVILLPNLLPSLLRDGPN
jgi:hypothetical protein